MVYKVQARVCRLFSGDMLRYKRKRGERMENDQRLSEKIRTLRRKSGMSQEELAEKLNVSRQAVSKWELGAAVPSPDKLVDISDLFDVTLDRLMREELSAQPSERELNGKQELPSDESEPSKTTERDIKLRRALGGSFLVIGASTAALVILLNVLGFGEAVNGSSMIRIDGTGLSAILAAALALIGMILLILPRKNR